MKRKLLTFFAFIIALTTYSQVDVALYQQFNGRYDFTFVGNTLNTTHNSGNTPCTILTSSSANLNLASGNVIEKAFLYWAGSGTGDLNIKLNGQEIIAERTFDVIFNGGNDNIPRPFFSAFADVTSIVTATGNAFYTVSDLDLTNVINGDIPSQNIYCRNGTNFGGWVIVVVYKNETIQLNQINIYDGLEFVPDEVNITLNNLNVLDSTGAKIGFVAWEGDVALNSGESLKVNNAVLSNALNPATNAFNSTNTVTGSTSLFNMDLDIYNIQDYIVVGDATAEIKLTSSADFVMINTIVTRLNSISPDATVTVTTEQECDSRTIVANYTIHNKNSTDILPAGTPVSVYLNGNLVQTFLTTTNIPINGSESGSISITVPNGAPLDYQLIFIADDDGTGNGIVIEINETNNSFIVNGNLWVSPTLAAPADLTACNTGDGTGIFDLSGYQTSLKNVPSDTITFYTSFAAAQAGTGNITDINAYNASSNPQEIFVRLTDEHGCFAINSFDLITVLCADATVVINSIVQNCDSRVLVVNYTVNNIGEIVLPAATPVAIYANNTLLTVTATIADIPVGGNETNTITITIPAAIPLNFNLIFVVDDNGTGTGIVPEMIETNNSFTFPVSLWVSPVLQQPADVTACETVNGSGIGIFDFSGYLESLKNSTTDIVTFHNSQEDSLSGDNDITDSGVHTSATGKEIFVRLEDKNGCFDTASFKLIIIDCYFPDGTVVIDDVYKQCNSRILHIHYTVSNFDGTDILPAGTPVAIYANGTLLDVTETINDIAIDGSENGFIQVTIPIGIPLDFDLSFVVDDIGNGSGIVIELDETNNNFTKLEKLVLSPVLQQPADIESCDEGLGRSTFDFSHYAQELQNYPDEVVAFYTSQQNADQDLDRIYNTSQYRIDKSPTRIFVRLDNGTCHTTTSFLLISKKCPPKPYNYVTPNGDGLNDGFFVDGLRNIFLNFKMSIYNRWGNLIWTGDHSKADWNAIADVSKVGSEGTIVPVGTYYFVLELNDPDFPEPIVGWVYVTK